jgi:Quinohemoprotein amine dehydrogenase, alpha subunit domain III
MKRLGLVLVMAVVGCSGSANLTPSVSSISPAEVFLARTLDVHLAGFGTMWTDGTTVDFGQGIMVNHVTAASATGLVANITIAADAPTGPRDVTVMDAGKNELFHAAFDVQSPVAVTFGGTQAQGSFLNVHIAARDLENLFDDTTTGDGLFTPLVHTNLKVTVPAGTTFDIDAPTTSVSKFTIDGVLFVDATAPAAKGGVTVVSGPAGGPLVQNPSPGVLDLQARTATAVASGTPASGNEMKAFDSGLYTFTPTAATSIQELSITPSDQMAGTFMAILPKSGAFADAIGFKTSALLPATSTDPFFLVAWDQSGTAGYTYQIARTETQATALALSDQNISLATAQTVASLPAVITGGQLMTDTSEAWFKLNLTGADVGKHVRVVTIGGDPRTDTVVDVLAQNGTTSLGGPSGDSGFHEDFTSDALTAAMNTVYVKIFASSFFDPAHKTYVAAIRLE